VIAAAGRLVSGKRFDLLIDAFSQVAAKYPEWTLRIYGAGPERERLKELIGERGLDERARLMGARSPIETEFAQAAIVASASSAESFGMTLAEAMRCGVPVVSTNCPLGPAEIITPGVDGLLVPVGDGQALADALLELVSDESARRHMGHAALVSARRFDPGPILERYEQLFAELVENRHSRGWRRHSAQWRRRLHHVLRR
jgi:glycosyltransferase involved in cell wall biosynthesis